MRTRLSCSYTVRGQHFSVSIEESGQFSAKYLAEMIDRILDSFYFRGVPGDSAWVHLRDESEILSPEHGEALGIVWEKMPDRFLTGAATPGSVLSMVHPRPCRDFSGMPN